MEIPSVRQLLPHIGEEKYQMLELNKRLESYLGRVKLLEEENQLLRGEIQALHRNKDTKSQRQAHEEALNLARTEVQAAWMKKDRVELEVSNLVEEMEALNAQRQKERAAQAEAKRKLAEYKKMLEDEWRTQIWLREQAAHLEKEVSLQVQVHQEEMASLKSTSALSKPILLAPQHGQTISLQGLGEEYSQRAAQAWQEAAGVYQRQVEQLEDSLNQARAHMVQINQEKKENQLYVQDLAKELESTKVKRELLEKNIAQQRERQNQELQQLQVEVEALELEKVDLGEQIGDLLVDTRDLLQTKMRLGLEVATYRALLDSESLRVNDQSTSKTSIRTESLLEALSKPHGIHPGIQTISASSLLSSPLTTSRSITHPKANLMTPTPSWSLTRSTQETPKRMQNGEKEEGISKRTATFQRTFIATSTRSLSGTGSVPFTPEKAHVEVSCAPAVSDCVVHLAVDEPDFIPSAPIKEDLEEPTLNAHVKEDLEEPMINEHVIEDLQEPTFNEHVKEDLEEFALNEHVKDNLEEPTLNEHVKEDLEEPMINEHVIEDLQEPTLNEHVKEDLEEPTLSAHIKEDLEEPTLSAHIKEDLEESTLSAHVTEDLEQPLINENVIEDLQEPTLNEHVKEDLEPTLSAHIKEDLKESTLSAHVTEDLQVPTLSEHAKEDLQESTLSEHAKEDLEESTLSEHAKEDLEESTLSEHAKEDLEESTLNEHAKEDLEELTLNEHVTEDLQEPTLSEHVKEELQEILTGNQSKVRQDTSGPEEAALISLLAGHLSSLPQTPVGEVPSNLHTEDTKGSEDGEEEETEVSTEMAQISHAPMFAWEENDTAIPEEKDVVSELELESENTSENYMQECRRDNTLTDSKQLGEDSENPALPLFEQTSLHSIDAFSHDEKKSAIITWADDAMESVANIPGVESLERAPEVERESIERWEEMDTTEEIEDEAEVERCGTEEQEGHHSDVELQEEETETEESKVEVRKEEKVSDGEVEKEEEEREMDEDIAVIDINLANARKEATVQDSSALELEVDPHRNSEHTEQTTDLVVETYQDDHLLVEDHAEEEQIQSDEDESLNISASWRTDLGEADSYAQENTLADTRPLIHYKSDEETDANTQASHMGVSDSEEEREKHEEVLMWSQNIAKRFDTMEDLSEQPEVAYSDNVVMEESAQTVVEENIDEITNEDSVEPVSEDILQGESTNVDINVDLQKDDTLVDLVENDFRNREESSQGAEETEKKNQVLLVQEQEKNSVLQDWSQSFVSETEQHALLFEQPATGEDDIAIINDNTETCNMESFMQIKSEGEGDSGVRTHSDYFPLVTDKPLLEPSQEQALEEESHEMPSTETTHLGVFPTESNLTVEQAFTKEEEDEQSNLSMLTHADFTDNLSQHSGLNSRPESQTNIANSDLEESNSSEDESPNASQCSQLLSHAAVSTKLLDFSNAATSGEASKNDSVSFTGLLEEMMKERSEEESVENYSTSQAAEWESVSQNKEEEHISVDSSSTGMHENTSSLPQMQEWEDLGHPDFTGASNNILSGMTMEDNKASEKEEIFQGSVLNEEPQTKEKENDLHSFFTSSIKEDIWSATKFEMAATFDSNDPIDTTNTIHPNQSMTFEEDWGELGSLKAANGKPEKEMSISTAQSIEEEEREEQEMPQAKQLQCQDVKSGQMEVVQSDDSVDDGDSWSSGEE